MASPHHLSHVDETPVAAFRRFLATNRSQGLRFGNSPKQCTFVPQDELESYLSVGRLQPLLESVCHKRFTPKEVAAAQTRLRILSILVLIDRGHLIEYCIKVRGLSDARLPLEAAPLSFSSDTFKRFDEEQWAFCAHEFQDSDCDGQILDGTILPFSGLEKKGSGRTATTSLVQIHPYYCFCATPGADEDESTDRRCTHEFIIKTYDGNSPLGTKSYHNEINAFQTMAMNEEANKFIVKFYGSFTQQQSHIVILEYADEGTLADYYQRFPNPILEADTTNFWEQLLNLARGLTQIHDVEPRKGESDSIFHGVHQDIKPSNILVFSYGETSPYRYTFKLADFGHSHFELHDEAGNEDHGKVAVGTRTYGPPDQYLERLANHKLVSAQRKGDVWSLASVYSEAASWVTYGPQAIEEYRQRRIKALSRVPGFKDGDCFHNGSSVLPEVESWHAHLAELRRASDRVTPKIWQILLQDCFKSHEQRFSAIQFLGRTVDLLNLQKGFTYRDSYYGNDNGKGREHTPTRIKRAHTHDVSISSMETTQHPRDSTGTTSTEISNFPSSHRSGENSDTSTGPSTPLATSPSTKLNSESPHTPDGFTHSSPRADIPSSPPVYSSLKASSPTSAILETRDKHLDHARIPPPQFPGHGKSESAISVADAAKAMSQLRMDEIGEEGASNERQCPIHDRGPTSKLPELSVDQVLQWMSRRKELIFGKDNEKVPNHEYLNRVEGRDHIFLVDDSLSMKSHWPDVTRVFKALSYLTKTVDDDGVIKLHFTVSATPHKSNKTTVLLSEVKDRERHLRVTSNPETACDKILNEWKKKMNPSRVKNIVSRSGPSMSAVTLYILTDGVWEDRSDLSSFVKDVVRFMEQHDMARKHIGIQFIQFGDDAKGSKRLSHLDSGLGLSRDIVDTIPSTGNVFKILLGPVDDTFDLHQEVPAGAQCTCIAR